MNLEINETKVRINLVIETNIGKVRYIETEHKVPCIQGPPLSNIHELHPISKITRMTDTLKSNLRMSVQFNHN
jgi:hypothetical protein